MTVTQKMIFISLPVSDVARSSAFYEAIGMVRNPAFSNAQSAAMAWSDTIHFMLADHAMYASLTDKPIVDPRTGSAMLLALSMPGRADVDAICEAAVAAGGSEVHGPEDHGFMYSRAFADPDGHGFGPMWMDPVAAANGPDAAATRTDSTAAPSRCGT